MFKKKMFQTKEASYGVKMFSEVLLSVHSRGGVLIRSPPYYQNGRKKTLPKTLRFLYHVVFLPKLLQRLAQSQNRVQRTQRQYIGRLRLEYSPALEVHQGLNLIARPDTANRSLRTKR